MPRHTRRFIVLDCRRESCSFQMARKLSVLPCWAALCMCVAAPLALQGAENHSSPDGLWDKLSSFERADGPGLMAGGDAWLLPQAGTLLAIRKPALDQVLSRAPFEGSGRVRDSSAVITLPRPDGSFELFAFVESPIMEPGLAARYPQIRTYLGQGLDNPAATVRFDMTPQGFHAQVFSPGDDGLTERSAYTIDPMWRGDTTHYVASGRTLGARLGEWDCLTPQPTEPLPAAANKLQGPLTALVARRELQLAVATSGEYTTFVSAPNPPNVLAGLGAVVTAVNRVNQIYETDLAVRLILVADSAQFIFTDPATDPYTGTMTEMQLQNESMLITHYPSGGYDIGHLFDQRVSGGNAGGIASVCAAFKGRGFTGHNAPTGDVFWVDYVAHEIGHQLGARHAFNGTTGSCGANRTAGSAYEPGSGITIMGYAGICGSDNLATPSPPNGASLPMFSFQSIQAIRAVLDGLGSACGTDVLTLNHAPTVAPFASSSYVVPTNTPFRLLGSWSDEDFGDFEGMTASWEQADLGPALPLGPDTGQNEPLFSVLMHNRAGERFFPQMSDVLNNVTTAGHYLPQFPRAASKYKFVVRDNVAGGGGTAMGEITIQFAAAGSGFRVTQPAGGEVFCGGAETLITWNSAGAIDPPVSCSTVDITMSYDNGQTFPLTVRADTPNVGFALVTIPALATEQARLMVSAVDNIFFSVNPAPFAVVTSPPTIVSQTSSVTICPGQTFQISVTPGGGGHRSFQWYKDGVLLPTDTGQILGRFNASNGYTGDYTCVVSNVCGQVTSTSIRVQIGVSFDAHPVAQNVTPCQNAVFNVAARGVGPLSYQWRRDSVPLVSDGRIVGATTPSLQITSLRYEDEGSYDCLVTDSCESRACNVAPLAIPLTPTWQLRTPTSAPIIRSDCDMAYDAHRGVCVLYGGYYSTYLTDTWEWDGVEWVQRNPAHSPGRRSGHAMTYDSDLKRVVLYGGFQSEVGQPAWPSDLWAYDGNDWFQLAGPTDIPLRESPYPTTTPELTYDSVRKRIILVRNQADTISNSETYEFDPATSQWSLTVPNNGFTAGYGGAISYDLGRNQVVHYYGNSGLFGIPKETWRYNGTSWSPDPATTPQMPFCFMQYDSTRRRNVIFYANYGSLSLYTVSYFDLGMDWGLLLANDVPDSPPAFRLFCQGMAYDSKRRAMVAVFADYYGAPNHPFITYEYRYLDQVVFDRHPQSQPLNPGGNATFTVAAAGYGTLAYQWKRNGQNLADGPAPGGGTISGAATANLAVTGVQQADGGIYTCLVSNTCDESSSNGALLGATVPPDFDQDGDVDGDDMDLFEACASGPGVPLTPGCEDKDLDIDGDADQSDFAVFQRCLTAPDVPADPACVS